MSKVTIYSPPSAAQVKNCTADFDLRRAPVPINLVQFDKTIPILAVALYKGGTAYKLPDDAEANVRMGKRNNLYIYNPVLGCNEGRTLVYVAVTPQMTTQDGVFYPILEVLADGGVAGTSPLQLVIQRNPVQEGDLEDTSEKQTLADLASQAAASANAAADSARIVQENKDAIQNANANMEAIKAAPANATAAADSAKEARSWAVGDTASRPGEGMDNAKYYAALAQQVSQGAVGWYPNYEALYAAHDTGYDGNWAIVGDTDTIWVWDSDTGVWKDTGESSKFANYYDKTQIDKMLAGYCPYGIDDVYVTFSSTKPTARWPGTSWERITDCFLRAADDSHPAGTTGGSWNIVQTEKQVAPHTHVIVSNTNGSQIKAKTYGGAATNYAMDKIATSDDYNVIAAANVGGQPMDITNKYIAAYIWQRTA